MSYLWTINIVLALVNMALAIGMNNWHSAGGWLLATLFASLLLMNSLI